jgi:Flp pilus assembly protein TadB
MSYLIIAIALWFLTGFFVTLFFGQTILAKVRAFNDRYAKRYAHLSRNSTVQKPEKIRRWMVRTEFGAFIFGTLLFLNPIFGLWMLGFVIFCIFYFARLLEQRERDRFDDQMVDVTYTFRNALKAGLTLQQAMEIVATDLRPPASEQFAIALREIQVGATVEEALRHIEERVNNAELKIMVNAVEILRQTGGNMIETFESVTETLKARKRVEGKIKTMTAQGRMGALILCAMPFGMLGILYVLNRAYVEPLFTTILGNLLLTLVVFLVATGWVLIKKIITIEV